MDITDEPNDGYSDDFDALQCPNCGGEMEFIPLTDHYGNRVKDSGTELYCCADCGHFEPFYEWDDEDVAF